MVHETVYFPRQMDRVGTLPDRECDPAEALQNNEICLLPRPQSSGFSRAWNDFIQEHDRRLPYCQRLMDDFGDPLNRYRCERRLIEGPNHQPTLYLIGQVHADPFWDFRMRRIDELRESDPEELHTLLQAIDADLERMETAGYQHWIQSFLNSHGVHDVFPEGLGREVPAGSCEEMAASLGSNDAVQSCENLRTAFIRLRGVNIGQDPRVGWQIAYLYHLGGAEVYARLTERVNLHRTITDETDNTERLLANLYREIYQRGLNYDDMMTIDAALREMPGYHQFIYRARELAATHSVISFLLNSADSQVPLSSVALIFGCAHLENLEYYLETYLRANHLNIGLTSVWWEGITEDRCR